jgi:hypothetical protein
MSRIGQQHVNKRLRVRWAVLAPLLALGLFGAPAAKANPIVCLTVYYEINDGTPQYVHDKCYLPSSYPTQEGGGGCWTQEEFGEKVKVCKNWGVSYPLP